MLGVLGKYLKGRKCHFYMSPDKANDRRETVVLVHGLIRRSYNMLPMGRFLRKNGFTIYVYDYKTSTRNIAGHGKDLRNYLQKIMAETPDDVPLNIVTHSMGGILTRYALGTDKEDSKNPPITPRVKRIVMLAPPHGGSNIARLITKYLPFSRKLLKPLPELSNSKDSVIHSVPQISGPEIGIVAGKYDSEVAQKDTYLEGMKEHIVIKSEHSFMVYLKSTRKTVLQFLTTGSFK
jgi:alpha-beta hydrolase superfamily lysophospholipase